MKYKPYKNEFCNEKEAKKLFQILPFFNILIEKPKVAHLSKAFKNTQEVIKLK